MKKRRNEEVTEVVQVRTHSFIHSVNSLNSCYVKSTIVVLGIHQETKKWPLISESLYSSGGERQ